MKIRCKKCGYSWDTKSKLIYITCPNCYNKVKNNSADEKSLNTQTVSKEKTPTDAPTNEHETAKRFLSRNQPEVVE